MIFVKIKIKAWNKGLVDYLAININRGKKLKKKNFCFKNQKAIYVIYMMAVKEFVRTSNAADCCGKVSNTIEFQ